MHKVIELRLNESVLLTIVRPRPIWHLILTKLVILVKLISIIIPVVLGLNEISVKLGSIIIPVVLLFIEIVVLADSNERSL